MPKALTIAGMAIAAILFLVFALDLAIGIPFSQASMMLDIAMVAGSGIMVFLGYTTFRELK